jgi:hypothetical protein
MAVKIISSRSEGMKDGKNYMRAEIVADSVSDLTVEGINNYHFTFGSIAWVVGSSEWYGLDSSGNWVKQGNGDSSAEVESTQQSNSAAPNTAPLNLNLNSGLNRPATLDEPKSATISTESEKADTSDSESVSEDIKKETEEQTEDTPEEVTEDEPETVEEETAEEEPTENVPDIDDGNIEEEPTEEEGE